LTAQIIYQIARMVWTAASTSAATPACDHNSNIKKSNSNKSNK